MRLGVIAGCGAAGYATRRDLSGLARVSFWGLLALIMFGIVMIFVNCGPARRPAGNPHRHRTAAGGHRPDRAAGAEHQRPGPPRRHLPVAGISYCRTGAGSNPGPPGRAPADGQAPHDHGGRQGASKTVDPAVLRQMVDAFQDGVALADDHGTVMLANLRLDAMFGYQRDEVLGHPVEFLLPSDLQDGYRSLRAGYDRAPRTRPMDDQAWLVGLRKDGTTFPAQISLSPVRTAAGRFTLAVIRDVTETRRLADLAALARAAVTAEQEHRGRDLLDTIITALFHKPRSTCPARQPSSASPKRSAVTIRTLALLGQSCCVAQSQKSPLGSIHRG
ncbi:MAG TPA: PAS domain S-box protein [Trebonia sp.]|nr:PAS domain S-box protein [Trebonia sp.]